MIRQKLDRIMIELEKDSYNCESNGRQREENGRAGRSGKDRSRIGEWWGNEVGNACVSIRKMEHLPRARAVHSAYSCVDDRNLKGERS